MVASHLILAGLLLSLLLLAVYGFLLGYPPPRFTGRMLSKKEQAILTACAEAVFPERGAMPLTGVEAGIVEFMDQHMVDLPRDKRLLIRLLFLFIEHSPWIFFGRRGPWQRFSSLSIEKRQAFLAEMATSRLYFRRLSFLSLRALMCMAYLAHPDIAARIGSTPNLRPFQKESGS